MNNSKTPKIVIGVGLVAVYAIGFTVFALRGKHDNENLVAQGTPSEVSAPLAADPAAAPLGLPEFANAPADASAPAAMPASTAPEAASADQAPQVTRSAVASQPRQRAEEVPVQSLPSPRPPTFDDEQSSRSNSGSNAVSDLAVAQTAAGESVTSSEQITSEEDNEIAETPAMDVGDPQ